MKLFAFYIGGRMKGAHLEVHDLRLCAGESVESCLDDLRAQWWGVPSSLHLDCWGELAQADGYDIALKGEAAHPDAPRLYFVHLGGYDPADFSELHRNLFLVADHEAAAKAKALKQVAGWHAPHRDTLYDVDALLPVADMLRPGWHIHLTKAVVERPFQFECGYRPIGKKS